MAIFQPPTNDIERHALLSKALDTANKDSEAGNNYLNQSTVTEIEDFLPTYVEQITETKKALGDRAQELAESNAASDKLQTHVRDLWDGLRRRTHRLEHSAKVLTYYGLPLSGLSPHPGSDKEWITYAETMMKGEAKAVEAGYTPVSSPDIEELKEVYESALKESGEAAFSDRTYDKNQETLASLRGQADEFVRKLKRDLDYFLYVKDEPSQRRIMRTYGLEFKFMQDEPGDEEPTQEETVEENNAIGKGEKKKMMIE